MVQTGDREAQLISSVFRRHVLDSSGFAGLKRRTLWNRWVHYV